MFGPAGFFFSMIYISSLLRPADFFTGPSTLMCRITPAGMILGGFIPVGFIPVCSDEQVSFSL